MSDTDVLAGIEAKTMVESLPLIAGRGPVDTPSGRFDVLVFDCPVPQEHGRARRGELFVAVPAPAGADQLVPILPAYISAAGVQVPGVPARCVIGVSTDSADAALADARRNLLAAHNHPALPI